LLLTAQLIRGCFIRNGLSATRVPDVEKRAFMGLVACYREKKDYENYKNVALLRQASEGHSPSY